jgi:hypothetical protein
MIALVKRPRTAQMRHFLGPTLNKRLQPPWTHRLIGMPKTLFMQQNLPRPLKHWWQHAVHPSF